MTVNEISWFSVSVVVDHDSAEAIEFAFNEMESIGTEINDMPGKERDPVTVVGYFEAPPSEQFVKTELAKAMQIYGHSDRSLLDVRMAEVKNEDWLSEWKTHWTATTIGRFIIAAPWHVIPRTDSLVLRIEPNMAFGTGTHETTQLCLKAIDELYVPGQSFLDVGTGTGILAIAVAMANEEKPAHIAACDTDIDAVAIARKNAVLNGVAGLIDINLGSISSGPPRFDLVCANLTLDVIVPLLQILLGKSSKTLLLSGILVEQEAAIIGELEKFSILHPKIDRAGEWISVRVDR